MTTTHIDGLDRSIHKTNVWLDEVAAGMGGGQEYKERAYVALRSVLHAVRDHLTPEEASHLAAHLPLLLAGVYWDGYNPAHKPDRDRSGEAFMGRISQSFGITDVDPEAAVSAVFDALRRHVPEGEMEHVLQTLPSEVRDVLTAGAS